MTARKQPGRRYGRPPKHDPRPEMQAPKPMTAERREDIVRASGRPTTARQERQFFRMGARSNGFLHLGHKPGFAATPKQKKVRR